MSAANLLRLTAFVEGATALLLLVLPGLAFRLLLGLEAAAQELVLAGRVLGAALLALSITCLVDSHVTGGRSCPGIVSGLLIYNLAATAILAHAGWSLHVAGPALWPAVLLHCLLAAWCGVRRWRPVASCEQRSTLS